MTKVRVHELAKELGMENKELVDLLQKKNVVVKNHMSTIEEKEADMVKNGLGKNLKTETASGDAAKTASEGPKKKNIVHVFRPQNTQNAGRQGRKSKNQSQSRSRRKCRSACRSRLSTQNVPQSVQHSRSGAESAVLNGEHKREEQTGIRKEELRGIRKDGMTEVRDSGGRDRSALKVEDRTVRETETGIRTEDREIVRTEETTVPSRRLR